MSVLDRLPARLLARFVDRRQVRRRWLDLRPRIRGRLTDEIDQVTREERAAADLLGLAVPPVLTIVDEETAVVIPGSERAPLRRTVGRGGRTDATAPGPGALSRQVEPEGAVMPVDPNAVDRLVALGRRQGFITTAQIDREMPVEHLTEIEIAEIVDRLERAGIPVELDEGLSTDRPDGRPDRADAPPAVRFRDDGDARDAQPSPPRLRPPELRRGAARADTRSPQGRGMGNLGLATAVVVAVVAAVIVLLVATS